MQSVFNYAMVGMIMGSILQNGLILTKVKKLKIENIRIKKRINYLEMKKNNVNCQDFF